MLLHYVLKSAVQGGDMGKIISSQSDEKKLPTVHTL